MIAPMVLGGAVLLLLRKRASQRAWWLAVALQALVVVTGFAALRTGEADEERVEAMVNEAAIETHEERAETFLIAATIVLGVALAGALLPRRVLPWLGVPRPRARWPWPPWRSRSATLAASSCTGTAPPWRSPRRERRCRPRVEGGGDVDDD